MNVLSKTPTRLQGDIMRENVPQGDLWAIVHASADFPSGERVTLGGAYTLSKSHTIYRYAHLLRIDAQVVSRNDPAPVSFFNRLGQALTFVQVILRSGL